MKLTALSCAFVLCAVIGLIDLATTNPSDDYPGVIELVGFNNRRARTHYIPPSDLEHQSKSKMAADIETVKQNIEKYNKLLKVDTKNLPESQKEILERIVERVARLKESLDISQQEQNNSTGSNESLTPATESQETTLSEIQTASGEIVSSSSIEDTTKNPDAMTTADAQLSMSTADEEDYSMTNQDIDINHNDEVAAKEIPDDEEAEEDEANTDVIAASDELDDDDEDDAEIPTSTIGSGEIDEDQFVAARSNNNNHRTLVSTSNSISKTKSRPNSTKRPASSSSTKSSSSTVSIKRVNGQKPSSMVGGSSLKQTTTYTAGSITTIQPMVKIQKPFVHQKEPETMMKVQHQLPQKQQLQSNKLQNNQQEQDSASTLVAIQQKQQQQQQQQQIEQKTVSPIQQTVQIQQRTPVLGGSIGSSSNTNTAASSLGSDLLYDSNVNTSSIIDSLNNAREEFYDKSGINNKDKKPSATAKPTKYHYYPHNQHIYLLPECAIQQVCNAVYVRLNYTQPLCACPSRYRDPCSASLNEDDQHTTKLVGDGKKKAITLAKTCEATTEMRECRSPKDWSLLALQNTRTGKSHYLVICRCPDYFKMEGPMAHDQPTYASVPGIRVFGMMCVKPGYSVRKPSAQPPKRYQLQKPYYIPSSQNKYSSIKDHSRPSYISPSSPLIGGSSSLNYQPQHHHHNHQQEVFQNQHQANYQYLNRPDSGSSHFASPSHIHSNINNHNSHSDFGESLGFSGGIYGRNNERNGEKPIPAAEEDSTSTSSSSSSSISSSSSSSNNPSSSSSSPISSTSKSEEISRTTAEIDALKSTTLEDTSKRDKRSIEDADSITEDDTTPEFPWQRAVEFERSIVWDD